MPFVCSVGFMVQAQVPPRRHGANASSAPVLQFDSITPWSSFYDGVSQDFKVTKLYASLYIGLKEWNLFGSK